LVKQVLEGLETPCLLLLVKIFSFVVFVILNFMIKIYYFLFSSPPWSV